jgi:uncharacterized protein (TIGR02246 family)
VRILFLAAGLCLLSCRPAVRPAFTDADRQAIDAQRAVWSAAVMASDVPRVVALYTEDAKLLPPNSPVISGRAAITQMFGQFPPAGDVKLNTIEVMGTDSSATVRGVYSMNLMPAGAPAAIADTGKFVELWRKQGDGSWLIVWDIWNSDKAPPLSEPDRK